MVPAGPGAPNPAKLARVISGTVAALLGDMNTTIQIGSVEDLNRIAPGFANVWRAIKADTGSRARRPKSVEVTDQPRAMMPNDSSCAARYALDLRTMLITSRRHVSAGECALMNRGQEKAIAGIPAGQAVISCEWNDHYRFFSMTVEVAPGTLAEGVDNHGRIVAQITEG